MQCDTSNISIKKIRCIDDLMQFLKVFTRRGMWSPLCLTHIWFLTVVSSHLLNEHLRCSPSLLPASTAILHKAHWGCRDWLTSQEHQRAATQPRHCGTAELFLHSLLTLVYLIILLTVWSKDVITTAAVLSHRTYFFTGKSAKIKLLALDTVA